MACELTPDVESLLKGMADDLLKAGHQDHSDLVELIHDQVGDYVQSDGRSIWKSEIADVISGYGKERVPTKDELVIKRRRLKAALRADARTGDIATGKIDPVAEKNAKDEKRLLSEIAKLKSQQQEGTPKAKVDRTARVVALQAELAALRKGRAQARADTPAVEAARKAAIEQRIKDVERQLAGGRTKGRAVKQDVLDAQATALKAELKDLQARLRAMPVRVNEARQTRYRKEIAELERRLAEGDYSKPTKTQTPFDDPTFELADKRRKLADQIENEIRRIEQENETTTTKVGRAIANVRRAMLFSSPLVFVKLGALAIARTGLTPAERAIGSMIRVVPGLRAIYDMAPTEGGGFNLRAEGAALKGQFSKASVKATWEQLTTGTDSLSRLGGKDHPPPVNRLEKVLHVPGQAHAAIKTNVRFNAFHRAIVEVSDHYQRKWIKEGMTPEQAAERLDRPSNQAMIVKMAAEQSKRAVSQQDSWLASQWASWLNQGRKAGGFKGMAANLADFELPVVKIGLNIADEGASFAIGGLRAMPLLYKAIKSGTKSLTPEQADYVARNLNKNGLGAALFALGVLGKVAVGGYYQQGDNKKKDILKEGNMKVGDVEIDAHMLHHPAFVPLVMGATYQRIVTEEHKHRDGSHYKKGSGDAMLEVLKGYGGTIPFMDSFDQISTASKSANKLGVFAGKQVASVYTPPALARYAKAHDPNETRKPETFTDALKMGIPGLRETVHPKGTKK